MTGYDIEAAIILGGTLAVFAMLTWILTRTLGRRIARTRPRIAFAVSALGLPTLAVVAGYALFRIDVANHPGSDWPAMGFLGALTLSGWSLLATVPTAAFTLKDRRVRP